MIILTMHTEHHIFEAAGNTDVMAQHALDMALEFHRGALGLEKDWWKGHYDIERRVYLMGEAYRDGQLLYREPA